MKKLILLIIIFFNHFSYSQNAEKFIEKGKVFINKSNFVKAIRNFDKAIEIDDQLNEAFFYRAYSKTLLKDYKQAVKDYTKVLELINDDELAYLNRGRIYSLLKKNEEAISDFKSALKIDNKFFEAYYDMARIQIKMKDLEGAISTYDNLIKINLFDGRAYYNRGLIKYRTGDKKGACDDARKAKTNGEIVDQLIESSCPELMSDESIMSTPRWPGCEKITESQNRECFQTKIQQHIIKYFRYPMFAQKNGIQGRVFVQFMIEKDGSIKEVRTRTPHPVLDEAAKKIISLIPLLIPAKQNGKPIRVPFSIPITYKLN